MRKIISALGIAVIFAGCAHSLSHGTIAMKESDTAAHVSIHDVKTGDRVTLFRSVCEGTGGGREGTGKTCRRQEVTQGTVRNVFNEHYSLVEFPSGTKFSEGDFVETSAK